MELEWIEEIPSAVPTDVEKVCVITTDSVKYVENLYSMGWTWQGNSGHNIMDVKFLRGYGTIRLYLNTRISKILGFDSVRHNSRDYPVIEDTIT